MHEQRSALIASGASTASTVNFSRAYPFYGIQVGSMSTAAQIAIFATTDAGVTFRQVFNPPNVQTSTVTNIAVQIGTLVGANGGYVVVNGGYKDFYLRTSAVVSGGVSFNIIGFEG